jgi:RNA polymerase sigma factor (sigma-70 family)
MKTTNRIEEMLQDIGKTFKILDDKERQILTLRHGLEDGSPKTLQEIANMLGVSKERIRQIESKALEKTNLVLKYDE